MCAMVLKSYVELQDERLGEPLLCVCVWGGVIFFWGFNEMKLIEASDSVGC